MVLEFQHFIVTKKYKYFFVILCIHFCLFLFIESIKIEDLEVDEVVRDGSKDTSNSKTIRTNKVKPHR